MASSTSPAISASAPASNAYGGWWSVREIKLDEPDTRSLPKKRRRAMLDITYRESLLSLV